MESSNGEEVSKVCKTTKEWSDCQWKPWIKHWTQCVKEVKQEMNWKLRLWNFENNFTCYRGIWLLLSLFKGNTDRLFHKISTAVIYLVVCCWNITLASMRRLLWKKWLYSRQFFLKIRKKIELEYWKPSVDDWENHSKGKCSRDTVSSSIKEKKKKLS